MGMLQQPEQMKLPLKAKRVFMTWTIAMFLLRPIQLLAKASRNKNDFTCAALLHHALHFSC